MVENTNEKFDVIFDFVKKSFEEVVQEISEEVVEACELYEIEDENKLTVVIGISGETNGRILLETSVDHGRNLAVAMNFGDELESEDDLYIYMGEFSNMFCGRTTTYINDKFQKREVWITPPAIFSARDLHVCTPHVASRKACYKSSLGHFVIDAGFRED